MDSTVLAQGQPVVAGLLNREELSRELDRALAEARQTHRVLAVVCLNVTEIPSRAGLDLLQDGPFQCRPEESDTDRLDLSAALLHSCAERISACLVHSDTIAHLGGPSFAVLLSSIEHSTDAVTCAHGLIGAFQRPFVNDGTPIRARAGAGVAVYPSDGDSPSELLGAAEEAARRAGDRISGQLVFSSAELHADQTRRRDIQDGIGPALANDEFVLHYQPVLGLSDGEVEAVEALIRWRHPRRGLISPMDFIPVAEQTGQIIEIGKWVLTRACRQACDWERQGIRVRMAVNLSARQFSAPDLTDFVDRTLRETGLDPSRLELELTESMLADPDSSAAILERLHNLGVRVAIDDFGTGFSSLSYLTRFPLDTLKIDRSFITQAVGDRDARSVLSSVISMAHQLGLRAVAEGVETTEQQNFLVDQRCDLLQGFLHSPPLPAEECERWLRERLSRPLRPAPADSEPDQTKPRQRPLGAERLARSVRQASSLPVGPSAPK
jgi:EAL domain-containing protein (putative c-di-GMP-specific phosphodiesterase class I)/GGDEF domain-containing protein